MAIQEQKPNSKLRMVKEYYSTMRNEIRMGLDSERYETMDGNTEAEYNKQKQRPNEEKQRLQSIKQTTNKKEETADGRRSSQGRGKSEGRRSRESRKTER